MFYLAVYAVMDLGAFGLIGSLSAAEQDSDLDDLAGYQGLGYSQPWRAAIFATCLISLAGLPPTRASWANSPCSGRCSRPTS